MRVPKTSAAPLGNYTPQFGSTAAADPLPAKPHACVITCAHTPPRQPATHRHAQRLRHLYGGRARALARVAEGHDAHRWRLTCLLLVAAARGIHGRRGRRASRQHRHEGQALVQFFHVWYVPAGGAGTRGGIWGYDGAAAARAQACMHRAALCVCKEGTAKYLYPNVFSV